MTTPKELIFDEQAREYLIKGISTLADVVAGTLGPKGCYVGLEKNWGAPTITNDGKSIVENIEVENQFENMGVKLTKEVLQKVKEICGDGTTTATLLLRTLALTGIKFIAAGASPISVKRGMDKAVDAVIKFIEKSAITVKQNSEIRNIATVSASGNAEIGDILAGALEKVGKNGVITIEEAKGIETTVDIVEGMEIDRGYISPYFVTNSEKLIVEMQNAKILILDKKISSIHEILPVLEKIAPTRQELLIIADDVEGDALSTLVINKLRKILHVAAIKAPGFGDRKKALLQDIATLTGGTVINDETGISLKDYDPAMLGSAEKITITKDKTVFVKGAGSSDKIKARIQQIENEIQEAKSSYDKEKLEERKAKLSGGVAVVHVGAATEPEMKMKKQMFEDSLCSTKAAIEDGIVPGGGIILLRAIDAIQELKLEGDESLGAQVVMKACQTPLFQIAQNVGYEGMVVLANVEAAKGNMGFNALNGKIEDLITAGVIDPAKVVKNSLLHAASAAGMVILSEVLIGDAEEEEEEKS